MSDFIQLVLLWLLIRVLKKLALDQIVDWSDTYIMLDPYQTDFLKHYSTQFALLKLTNEVRVGMGKKRITILLQFDFSKAFDTISPSLLLLKLMSLCFSKTTLWQTHSYLCNYSQYRPYQCIPVEIRWIGTHPCVRNLYFDLWLSTIAISSQQKHSAVGAWSHAPATYGRWSPTYGDFLSGGHSILEAY